MQHSHLLVYGVMKLGFGLNFNFIKTMIVETNNQEFVFQKEGLKTVAPAGSKVYVVVQDMLKGKVVAHGRIMNPENKEIGFMSVGEVEGLAMSSDNVLAQCHTAVINALYLINQSAEFDSDLAA